LCFQPDRPGPKIGQPGQLRAAKEAVYFLRAEEAERLRGRIILTGVFPGGGTMRSLEDTLDEVPGVAACATTVWRLVHRGVNKPLNRDEVGLAAKEV